MHSIKDQTKKIADLGIIALALVIPSSLYSPIKNWTYRVETEVRFNVVSDVWVRVSGVKSNQ